jgi:hypothetical protein
VTTRPSQHDRRWPVVQCTTHRPETVVTSRRPASPALLFVPTTSAQQVRFRVLTPDCHPIAVTVEPALAAATALAVARHHAARYAVIAASDGRWLEVDLDGGATLTPADSARDGWPTTVERALGRLAPPRPTAQGAVL